MKSVNSGMMWQVFLDATLRVSRSNVPLLHETIPIIDILTTALEDTADDKTKLIVVRAAAKRGLCVLNKYYSKTDESIMHRCAMSKYILLCSCLRPLNTNEHS